MLQGTFDVKKCSALVSHPVHKALALMAMRRLFRKRKGTGGQGWWPGTQGTVFVVSSLSCAYELQPVCTEALPRLLCQERSPKLSVSLSPPSREVL